MIGINRQNAAGIGFPIAYCHYFCETILEDLGRPSSEQISFPSTRSHYFFNRETAPTHRSTTTYRVIQVQRLFGIRLQTDLESRTAARFMRVQGANTPVVVQNAGPRRHRHPIEVDQRVGFLVTMFTLNKYEKKAVASLSLLYLVPGMYVS